MPRTAAMPHIDFQAITARPNPPKFQAGDMLTFEKAEGDVWTLVLLERSPGAAHDWECLWWDGRPHQIALAESVLELLRVVKRERCAAETVQGWRDMLSMEAAA